MEEKDRYFYETKTGAALPEDLERLHLTYEDERRVLAANNPRGVVYALEGMVMMSDGFTPEDVDAILELDSENVSMTLVHDVGFSSSTFGRSHATFTPTQLLSAYRSGEDLAPLHPYAIFPEEISHFAEPGHELTPEERAEMIQWYEDSITSEWIERKIRNMPCRALERASARMTDDQFSRAAALEPDVAREVDPDRFQRVCAPPRAETEIDQAADASRSDKVRLPGVRASGRGIAD